MPRRCSTHSRSCADHDRSARDRDPHCAARRATPGPATTCRYRAPQRRPRLGCGRAGRTSLIGGPGWRESGGPRRQRRAGHQRLPDPCLGGGACERLERAPRGLREPAGRLPVDGSRGMGIGSQPGRALYPLARRGPAVGRSQPQVGARQPVRASRGHRLRPCHRADRRRRTLARRGAIPRLHGAGSLRHQSR